MFSKNTMCEHVTMCWYAFKFDYNELLWFDWMCRTNKIVHQSIKQSMCIVLYIYKLVLIITIVSLVLKINSFLLWYACLLCKQIYFTASIKGQLWHPNYKVLDHKIRQKIRSSNSTRRCYYYGNIITNFKSYICMCWD